MAIIGDFISQNFNLFFLSVGMILSILISKKMVKNVSQNMIMIVIANFVLAIIGFINDQLAEIETGNLALISIIRMILYVITYTMLPLEITTLIYIMIPKSKYNPLIYIPTFIIFLAQMTCFFTDKITFQVRDNILYFTGIFRFISTCSSLALIIILVSYTNYQFKESAPLERALLVFTGVCCIISSLLSIFDYKKNLIYLTIALAITFFFFFEHLQVIRKNEEALEQISRIDSLTGLLNDKAYIEIANTIDDIHKDYTVVMMDLNNLKATNDRHGHHFGCHLVVECGHILKEIFQTSYVFHIGGDEFVAILVGEDYDDQEELIQQCKDRLYYQSITFEGKKLILSVAMGIATKKNRMKYRTVFQSADEKMYEEKLKMKDVYPSLTR